jgi:hypothetical protein
MNIKTALKWAAIIGGAMIVGAAYGPKIPVIKQAARALPKSAVL